MEGRNRAINLLGESWGEFLHKEFSKPYMMHVGKKVAQLRKIIAVYPDKEDVFKALKLCPYRETHVVILGQD